MNAREKKAAKEASLTGVGSDGEDIEDISTKGGLGNKLDEICKLRAAFREVKDAMKLRSAGAKGEKKAMNEILVQAGQASLMQQHVALVMLNFSGTIFYKFIQLFNYFSKVFKIF